MMRAPPLALIMTLVVLVTEFLPAETLVFSRQEGITNTIAERVLTEAYRTIGVTMETTVLPAERSLIEANAGHYAGDVARVDGLATAYPNLIQVPFVLLVVEGGAFTKDPAIAPHSWDDLRPYRVGFRTGLKFAELNTLGMAIETTPIDAQSFEKLARGRLDVVISGYWDGLVTLKNSEQSGIAMVRPPLIEIKLYHYLNTGFQKYVEPLVKALQALKAKGRIQAIQDEVLAPYH